MAYATYTTEAIVCGSKLHNTSDKSFLLFTRDAGMVYATARSVREERSKQRCALQDFALIRVSLVRGKSGWRVGSAVSGTAAFSAARSRQDRAALVRIVKLLRQFVHGEEPQPALFEDTKAALQAVCTSEAAEPSVLADMFALRLLHKLGYIAADDSFRELLTAPAWTAETNALPPQATRAIERAAQVSHL